MRNIGLGLCSIPNEKKRNPVLVGDGTNETKQIH